MRYKKSHPITFFILLQLLAFSAFAGTIRFHNRLQTGVTTTVKDSLFSEVNPKTGSFTDIGVSDILTVGIDPNYPNYIGKDSTNYQVRVEIDGYDQNDMLISTSNQTLTVIYNPFGKMAYKDQATYVFSKAYKYRVKFLGVSINGTSSLLLPNWIYIEADIEVERYYNFASSLYSPFILNTATPLNIDCDLNSIYDELELSWNTCFGSGTSEICPESYDLEWTFVNDYDSVAGQYIDPSKLQYDFANNSTRVNITCSNYRISLVYEHGYLLYRVRGNGNDVTNINNTLYGVWSSSDNGTVASATYYHITQAHQTDELNWQYNASFAEEGKKKEVVAYYDGSLRNRQSVTKMNSDKNTLVGETIYDYQGRPAVNALPVPVDFPTCDSTSQPAIKFYSNFNQDDSTYAYSRNDFDVDGSGSCESSVAPMGTKYSGASHYYSSDNPNQKAQQAFLPDAKKYPFTQVEYTPDNTGRIKRQGGVGINHQLNTGHETTYFYGQPTQIALDRMFGSEVGDASHYKENVVIDANGQSSLTYINQEGKTIATSLAGDSASGLYKLPSNQLGNPKHLTADLFNKNALGNSQLNTVNLSGNALEFNSQLLVPYNGTQHFSYSMTVDTMGDACLRNGICFSCIYDLEMHIYTDCGIDLLEQKLGHTLKKTIGKFTKDADSNLVFNVICTGPNQLTESDTFSLFLTAGNYSISKVLTVNQQAVNFYVGQYLDSANNSCYKTLNSYIDSALAHVDTASCHITCASCVAALGDRDAYVASGKGTYMAYDALVDACNEPCMAKSNCYISYLQMVADMAPGGQYADYLTNDSTINPAAFPLSVYNSNNSLPKNIGTGKANWHYPSIILNNTTYPNYTDENGNISTINISYVNNVYTPAVVKTSLVQYDATTSTYYTQPENLLNFSDFLANWQSTWANSLVIYHPEYCYYLNCSTFSNTYGGNYSSDNFDALLQNSDAFSDGMSAGLINNYSAAPHTRAADYTHVNTTSPYDPFLFHGGSFGNKLIALLNNYQPNNTSYTPLTMVQMAAFYTRCGNLFGNSDTTGCTSFGAGTNDSIKNLEWQTFVGIYLSNKQTLQNQYLDSIVKGSGCPAYSGCMNDSNNTYNGTVALGSEYNDPKQPCGSGTYQLYVDKIRRFGSAQSMVPSSQNDADYQNYLATGQCPMASELQNLLNQLAGNDQFENGLAQDMYNYPTFSPDIYQALGGDVKLHYKHFYWNSTTTLNGNTASSLDATFNDSANNVACSLHLDLSTLGLSNFKNYKILGVTGLSDTTYLNYSNAFRIYLILEDTTNTSAVILYKKVLGYSTCFNIANCNFQQVCTPTNFAMDLQKLMSVLAANGNINSSKLSLNNSTYGTYITQQLKNQLFSPGYLPSPSNNLIWNYNTINNSNYYQLYDSQDTSFKIIIHSNANLGFSTIIGFNHINSTVLGSFNITALNSSNDSIGVVYAEIYRQYVVSGDTTETALAVSACDFPTSYNCQGTEYELQNQLQLLVHDILIPMPANHNVDLVKLPNYSTLLAASFPFGLDTTSSVIKYPTTGWGKYMTQLLFTVKSTTDSCAFTLNADTVTNQGFDHIISFTGLKAYGTPDAYGDYYQFYGIATYVYRKPGTDGPFTRATDTIFGQSCLPIKNCCACGTDTVTNTSNTAIYRDTCSAAYNNYLQAVQFHNRRYEYCPVDIITYADAIANNYCGCINSYLNYLATFIYDNYGGRICPKSITDYNGCSNNYIVGSPTNPDYCIGAYNVDTNKISAYNTFILSHKLHLPVISTTKYSQISFGTKGFCPCLPSYTSYLQSIIDGVISPTQVDTNKLDINNFCNPVLPPPCKPYVPVDTIPPVFPIPPPDSSCVKYALSLAVENATNQYNQYKDSITTNIAGEYVHHCLGAFEKFTDTYLDKQYHYTLYYYDQAGNLIRTVPPEGVHLVSDTTAPSTPLTVLSNAEDSICYDRTYNLHNYYTDHSMPTTYLYNSLNQLVKQSLPDHDPINIWEYATTLGLDNNLNVTGVQFVNQNTGYLTGYVNLPDSIKPGIGRRGYIYSTSDAGKSWQPMPDVLASFLNKIQLVTNYTGFAVGKQGIILKTQDGGNTWDLIPSLQKYTKNWSVAPDWNDLYFTDSTKGIIVGSQGKTLLIDLTQTNSANCIDTTSLPHHYADTLTGVTFNGSVAYASAISSDGYGYLYKSTSNPFVTGNLAWRRVTGIPADKLLDVQFVKTSTGNSTGFISGINGTLIKTSNGGASWSTIKTGLANDIQSIYFRNDSVGIALIDSAVGYTKVYTTSNGGKAWTLISNPDFYYNALSFYTCSNTATADKAFVVGKSGLINRIVAGTNATVPYYGTFPYFGLGLLNAPNTHVDFNAVAAATYTASSIAKPKVIIGASNGKAYFCQKADSSILVWDSVVVSTVPISKLALSLNTGTNYMQAVAIDNNGTLYGIDVNSKTISSTSIATQKFSDVTYNNSANAFYAFNNGDKTPYKITFPTTSITATAVNNNSLVNQARAIAYTGSDLVVVGDSGDIYKDSLLATGSGMSWKNYSTALKFAPLRDVQADSVQRTNPAVYAVGDNGLLLQQLSGDTTWKKIATTTHLRLNSIKFYNRFTGAIAADNGTLYSINTKPTALLTIINTPSSVTARQNDISINVATKEAISAGNGGTSLFVPDITAATLSAKQLNMGAVTTNLNGVQTSSVNAVYFAGTGNSIYLVLYSDVASIVTTQSIMRSSQIFGQGINKAHFANTANGYLIGDNGFIRHTNDGQTWQIVLPDLSQAALKIMNSLYTYQNDNAIMVGKAAYMVNINNTTVSAAIPVTGVSGTPDLNDIKFGPNSSSLAYVVGNSGTAFQLNLPASINILHIPAYNFSSGYNLKSLFVFLDNSFITVGDKGSIAFYNAKSTLWNEHDPPVVSSSNNSISSYSFNAVYFTDDQNGYVAGNAGVMLRWNSSTNIQQITSNSTPSTTYFTKKPTTDNFGTYDSTQVNITCLGFTSPTNGFLGGNYLNTVNNANYARLLHDEGLKFSTFFWYDQLGRMVVSQNSKQFAANPKKYSYTVYDALGRITEVGENRDRYAEFNTIFTTQAGSGQVGSTSNSSGSQVAYLPFKQWLNYGIRMQVTKTYYDTIAFDSIPLVQQNLRKRVSSVVYTDSLVIQGSNFALTPAAGLTAPLKYYNHATHYSYDIHGNVSTLIQDNPSLASLKQRYKRIDYDYDLISGKVNYVYYEPDSIDQFTHKYEYDADNRITDVHTSSNKVVWDHDAKYYYYAHGPLARAEYGTNHIQGIDYAYTIQGWIKGVNSEALDPHVDMGKDGLNATGNPNSKFAHDAYGYGLTYFDKDYDAINPAWKTDTATRFLGAAYYQDAGDTSDLFSYRNNLYNGNIVTMSSSITDPGLHVALPMATSYRYDQLNRLVQSESFAELLTSPGNNVWNNENIYLIQNGLPIVTSYLNAFSYDANGNILSQIRKDIMGITFDSLTYSYNTQNGYKQQNRLYNVNDIIPASVMTDDIDNQGAYNNTLSLINKVNNYSYDQIGNLVKDSAEGIVKINWTVYGKIKDIIHQTGYYKMNGTDTIRPPDLCFNYDAAGNRISKTVKPRTATGLKAASYFSSTYYVRDAQGNVLSTYKQRDSTEISTSYFTQTEKHIYGSSRIGIDETQTQLIGATIDTVNLAHNTGNRLYELSNHLGNVLSTLSDKRIQVDPTTIPIIYPDPDICIASIDSLGGMKIQPLHQYAGINFVYHAVVGQSCQVDFYVNVANTNVLADFANGDYPVIAWAEPSSPYGAVWTSLDHTGHYTFTVPVYDTTAGFKIAYFGQQANTDYHHLLFDSLHVVKVGSTDTLVTDYIADLKSVSDVSPFGAPLAGRTWSAGSYRYGFNGQEKDDEEKGAGNSYNFNARIYDPRLGIFLSLDPVFKPFESPYTGFDNNPIFFSDPSGMDVINAHKESRDKAKEKYNAAQEKFDKLKSGDEGYKQARKDLKTAKNAYSNVNAKFQRVEEKIQAIKDSKAAGVIDEKKTLYDEANELTDPGGNKIDIYVYDTPNDAFKGNVTDMGGNPTTQKNTYGDTDEKSDVEISSANGTTEPYNTVKSANGPNTVVVRISDIAKVQHLAHEFGHAIYQGVKMNQYVEWLNANPSERGQGGHGKGDPSGQAAVKASSNFIKAAGDK
jgi:RHS repeat-associated protein